jgi:pullulanase
MRLPTRCLVLVVALALAGCGGKLPSPSDLPAPAMDAPLGVAFDGTGGATFRVWAPLATHVELLFFSPQPAATLTSTTSMTKVLQEGGKMDKDGWNGVWTVHQATVASGQLYQYAVEGQRALDPYAMSMAQFDSAQQVGMGAAIDMTTMSPLDPAGAPTTWTAAYTGPAGYASREDAVIYEVHVRDATIMVPGLTNPVGTYRAFVEGNVLDHARALGATHVQLLPVLAYYSGNESQRRTVEDWRSTQSNIYNWGYDPQNYFSPDGMYSADPKDPALRVKELMTLVNEAHARGLGVTLDVVFNHTPNRSIFDPLALDYYYRPTSYSFAGPDLATERRVVHKLVVDSIVHWVRDYKVDGFRFDLMGLMDSATIEDAYAQASAINPKVLFIGEGWRSGLTLPATDDLGTPITKASQDWMMATDHAAVFSDSFRDVIKGGGMNETDDLNKGFVTLSNPDKAQLLSNLRGDPTNFAASTPGDSVQYLTAHDGLTLHDKIGKILHLARTSPEIYKAARLAFALQATAQGIVFINGGCEFGRSKWVPSSMAESTPSNAGDGTSYVYNSYSSSDGVNGFDWTQLAPGSEGARLAAYEAGLLALRRSSDAFRLGSKLLATGDATHPAHVTMIDGGRANAIAYQVTDKAGATRFSVFVNAATTATTLATGADLTGATVVVDSDEAGTAPVTTRSGFTGPTATNTITLDPRTAVVFRW